jgi:2-octaprenyl-6-methoxyphenol hydroxylase
MVLEQLKTKTSATQPSVEYDLTIVGGSVAGATLACALRDSGLRVVLVEAQPQSAAIAKRQAYAISLLSGRIFAGIGVWQTILSQIATFRQIRLSDADHPGVVSFHPTDVGTPALGYVAEHRPLLSSLYEFLADCPNISWLCPAKVVDVEYETSGATIEVELAEERRQIRTRLVVAADGARSRIRTAAGIGTHGWQYWQSCVTARIRTEKSHNNTAFERFWSSGPMGVLPVAENLCQVVWTAPHAEAQALRDLDEAEFLAKLEHRTGGLLGHLELDSQRLVFPVQLMQSDRYVQSRLALIGDAAHCCHPVGGQGLNMGIRDAAALAQVLQDAIAKGEDIGNLQVLQRYERWRKLENWVILGFTDFLDRLFSNNWLPLVAIRRLGLLMLRRIHPLKSLVLRLMTGLLGRSPRLAQGQNPVQLPAKTAM